MEHDKNEVADVKEEEEEEEEEEGSHIQLCTHEVWP